MCAETERPMLGRTCMVRLSAFLFNWVPSMQQLVEDNRRRFGYGPSVERLQAYANSSSDSQVRGLPRV
jgi:hypothetical protein